MTDIQGGSKLSGKLIPIALVLLVIGCAAFYAGYRYALGDVCIARERFAPYRLRIIVSSLVGAGMALWGAVAKARASSTGQSLP